MKQEQLFIDVLEFVENSRSLIGDLQKEAEESGIQVEELSLRSLTPETIEKVAMLVGDEDRNMTAEQAVSALLNHLSTPAVAPVEKQANEENPGEEEELPLVQLGQGSHLDGKMSKEGMSAADLALCKALKLV